MRAKVDSAPLILMVSVISDDEPTITGRGNGRFSGKTLLLRTNLLPAAVRRYSFRIIQPSRRRIPTTKRNRGVASIIPSDGDNWDALSSGFLISIFILGRKDLMLDNFCGDDSLVSTLTVKLPMGCAPKGLSLIHI